MVREVKLIKDIQAQQRGWTVKVVIIEKAMARVSKSSPNKYQRLILADEEGNKIQATIYGGDIHIFRDTLIIGKNYYISNAWVKEIGAQYQIVQNNLQWTINGRTIVEEVTGDSEIIVPAVYSFVPFSRLHTYIDSLSHVDISGSADNAKIEQMSNEDKVLADLVSKPTARNNATKKLKLMISKSADEADLIALNLESSHLQFGEGSRKQFAELKDNA
ncbi:replication protein A 70 kDa DNA-binding subunit B isoform X2 [Ziziphus jujuba]|uniref:Replication protein A 70 kDa DNA-binding subunit B isoform X2 n=1 Tax=Ziziphus jujuba TaxID=326968 RepID=A0ABM3ZWU8_ZIZJJ|nr:replication protein A 70 kDa DNA-binding subunit B isoform X2 [Ziziphus jujuba]